MRAGRRTWKPRSCPSPWRPRIFKLDDSFCCHLRLESVRSGSMPVRALSGRAVLLVRPDHHISRVDRAERLRMLAALLAIAFGVRTRKCILRTPDLNG